MADIPMPDEIITWMASHNWGRHHLRWHVERIWDRLGPSDIITWAQQQGWTRYPIQEGEETNGLAFLAMHRIMISALTTQFPAHAALFSGWSTPPTDPSDSSDPVPPNAPAGGPFRAEMATAIERIETPVAFDGDDHFGLFVETVWRPFPNQPTRRSQDSSSGIHNYLHARFANGSVDFDMGNPEVNIKNQRFWRLHGWIDRKWTDYRAATGRNDSDPQYRTALEEARHHMMHLAPMTLAPGIAATTPPEFTQAVARVLFAS